MRQIKHLYCKLHRRHVVHADLERVLRQIGEAVAVLHDGGMVHGDLTTSNLMVRSRDNALVSFLAVNGCQIPRQHAACAAKTEGRCSTVPESCSVADTVAPTL